MSSVGVLGAGRVGTEFAVASALGQNEVRLFDRDAKRTRIAISKNANINAVNAVEELANCDVLIEAVSETLNVKLDALNSLREVAKKTAIIVTTTSSFTVTELGSLARISERLIGIHITPKGDGSQIEIAETAIGADTAIATVLQAKQFLDKLGWIELSTPDQPGRIVRRLLIPFLNQVVQALDDGVASQQDIDQVVIGGLGHSIGPFERLEGNGIEDHLAVARQVYETVHYPSIAPPSILYRMAAAGRVGVRTGNKFDFDGEGQK